MGTFMAKNSTGKAVEKVPAREISDMELAEVSTFEEALNLANDIYGGISAAHEEMGTGFEVLDKEEKGQLVGAQCFFLQWAFHVGDMGEFVSANVIVRNSDGSVRKVVVNDGSTGIYKQLAEYTEKTGKQGGLLVKNGLRRSDYKYTDKDGQQKPATTFYIDTSA